MFYLTRWLWGGSILLATLLYYLCWLHHCMLNGLINFFNSWYIQFFVLDHQQLKWLTCKALFGTCISPAKNVTATVTLISQSTKSSDDVSTNDVRLSDASSDVALPVGSPVQCSMTGLDTRMLITAKVPGMEIGKNFLIIGGLEVSMLTSMRPFEHLQMELPSVPESAHSPLLNLQTLNVQIWHYLALIWIPFEEFLPYLRSTSFWLQCTSQHGCLPYSSKI